MENLGKRERINDLVNYDDINKKVDKIDGKGLSTNDYTTAEKTKLEGIAAGATATSEATVSGWGFTKNVGTYVKPKTGIPASDLASGVIPTTLPASDVKAWAKADNKPTYTASEVGALANTITHISGDIAATEKGVANGVATLGSDGKIPSGQLPSYVDDVLEYAKKSDFPVSGESGKIYVDRATNLAWRWSGSTYTEISPSLALGETSSTAYAGDKGKALADKLAGIAAGAEVNVQSDWNITDTTSDAYIKNKPTIPSAVTESTVSGWGFTKNTGTYSKPSGGIPKTDLASAVQTSLGKADTALQEHQSLANYVKTDDSRLSDTRTPKAHTHPTSDITDFDFSAAMLNRGEIENTTDFNTITKSGCYKVQMRSGWGDAEIYHSPNEYDSDIYHFGLLFVVRPDSSLSENRILQIYFPYRGNETAQPVLMRMHNDSDLNLRWYDWHRLSYDTWRGIQNNLTSDSTTDSLSAAQGKALKALIDGKADKTTGNATTAGLTKLYTALGDATDGTMTQAAIKAAIEAGRGGAKIIAGTYMGNSTNPRQIDIGATPSVVFLRRMNAADSPVFIATKDIPFTESNFEILRISENGFLLNAGGNYYGHTNNPSGYHSYFYLALVDGGNVS